MKVKLSVLVNSVSGLEVISKKDLPVKTAYALSKNIQKIDTELKAFNEVRNKLFEKYGEKIKEDGKNLNRIKQENIEIFHKELNEMLDQEVEIDLWMVDVNSFGESNISTNDLLKIDFFIKEEKIDK